MLFTCYRLAILAACVGLPATRSSVCFIIAISDHRRKWRARATQRPRSSSIRNHLSMRDLGIHPRKVCARTMQESATFSRGLPQ
jgi:hypothetical protein